MSKINEELYRRFAKSILPDTVFINEVASWAKLTTATARQRIEAIIEAVDTYDQYQADKEAEN